MRHWMLFLVVALILALGVLATLQVRWITDVSTGRQQRLTAELDAAAQRFDDELALVAVAHEAFDARMPELASEPARRLFATENRDGFDVAIARADRIVVRSNPAWPRSVQGAEADLV